MSKKISTAKGKQKEPKKIPYLGHCEEPVKAILQGIADNPPFQKIPYIRSRKRVTAKETGFFAMDLQDAAQMICYHCVEKGYLNPETPWDQIQWRKIPKRWRWFVVLLRHGVLPHVPYAPSFIREQLKHYTTRPDSTTSPFSKSIEDQQLHDPQRRNQPDYALMLKEHEARLQKIYQSATSALAPSCQVAAILHFGHGMTDAEAAKHLNINEGTFRVRLSRAKLKLTHGPLSQLLAKQVDEIFGHPAAEASLPLTDSDEGTNQTQLPEDSNYE